VVKLDVCQRLIVRRRPSQRLPLQGANSWLHPEYARRVEEDQKSGLDSGVSGTPTFYIDGTRYDGCVALRDMLATIRQLHPDLEPGDTAATNPRIPRVRWPVRSGRRPGEEIDRDRKSTPA
jgi:hypothetical protein